MITICPQCQLSLAVSAADLRIAQGHVRCGRCASVFNALVTLYDTEADALETPATDASPDAALEPALADAGDTRIFEVRIDTDLADGGANTGVFERGAAAPEAPAPAGAPPAAGTPAAGTPAAGAPAEPAPTDATPSDATPFDAAPFDAATFDAPEFEAPSFDAPLIDTPAAADAIEIIELDDLATTGEAPALQEATRDGAGADLPDGIDLAADSEPVAANDELLEMPPAANDAGIDEVVAANDPILVPDRLDIDLGALDPPAADVAPANESADPATPEDIEVLEAIEPARPRYHAAYAAGSALLALLFAAQLVHQQRESLVAWPALSGPLSRFYAAIGQPIELRGDLRAYDVRQLGAFAPPDAAGTLLVRASLRNLSPRPQPMPLLRVTLQDRYGNRIASRDLTAEEYQQRPAGTAPEALLAAGARLETAVQLVDPGGNAVGFELDVCLAEGSATRCANDIPATAAAR
ncbi:MAG: zinc-ribbon and DUF3426 domain-containing protein [Steroidobacteraceae bacterium]